MIKFYLGCLKNSKLAHHSRCKIGTGTKTRLKINRLVNLTSLFLALSCAFALPTSAAEKLTLQVGPIKRSVSVQEIEKFAQTGEISPSLKFYKFLLTPQVQQLLNRKLKIEPKVVDTFVDQLLESRDGQRLIEHLFLALPGTSVERLKTALSESLREADGLNAISFLKAYPGETLTIDATSAIDIFVQLNASYLQSKVLTPLLERELFVDENETLPSHLDPTIAGEGKVRRQSLPLYDSQRERRIQVDLYYNTQSSGPLVVMSHGFAADRHFLRYLAKHLASHGLSVVSIEHPGSNMESLYDIALSLNPDDFLSASEFIDRPEDVTFVLNEIERLSDYWRYLKDKFNTKQVSVIGHSLGGYTALALGGGELDLAGLRSYCQNYSILGRSPADWLQCAAADLPDSKLRFRDTRVVQAIALNPLVGKIFGEEGLGKVRVPTMILTGTDDAVSPSVHHQLKPFQQLQEEKYLIAALGGTHMSATDLGNLNTGVGQSTLVKELMGEEAEPIRQMLRGVSLAFLKQLTPEAEAYEPFLRASYVQSFTPLPTDGEKPSLQLRLTSQIPTKINRWLHLLALQSQEKPVQDSPTEQSVFDKTNLGNFVSRLVNYPKLLQVKYSTGQLNSYFSSRLVNYENYQ